MLATVEMLFVYSIAMSFVYIIYLSALLCTVCRTCMRAGLYIGVVSLSYIAYSAVKPVKSFQVWRCPDFRA